MAAPTYSPHPLLKEPVLYVVNPPKHVQWDHLKTMFDRCGQATTSGKYTALGTAGRESYHVRFTSLFEAEMALATLQGESVPGISPDWSMVLSHSPILDSTSPTGPRYALHAFRGGSPSDVKYGATSQMIFRWFRTIGPLVSARVDVNMGNSKLATVIEYWDTVHAEIARFRTNQIHEDLQRLPIFGLRFHDICSLRCSTSINRSWLWGVYDSATVQKELVQKLTQFGEMTNLRLTNVGKLGATDTITFLSPRSAARALEVLDGEANAMFSVNLLYQELDLPYHFSEWPAWATTRPPSKAPATDPPTASIAPHAPTNNPTPDQPHGTASNSHPLLSIPILYVVNPPTGVRWAHLRTVFTSRGCGNVSDLGKSAVTGEVGTYNWAVRFIDLYHAEMALATMQEIVVVSSNVQWVLTLSHSPTLAHAAPSTSIFSQYLQTSPSFFESKVTAQLLFRCFRTAGPLVSVRVDVDVGTQRKTAVVQYWYEKHANVARNKKNALHKKTRNRPSFTLRTFDPYSLCCSGSKPFPSKDDLVDAFSEFGKIVSATLKSKKDGTFGIITFSAPEDAARALQAMDGQRFRGNALTVRYEEPDAQHIFRRPVIPTTPPRDSSEGTPNATNDIPPSGPSPEELRREAYARELREAAGRRAKEAAARASAEAKVRARQGKLRRKEEAERVNAQARKDIESATSERQAASDDFQSAKQVQEAADQDLVKMKEACAEAKRLWLEASDREAVAARRASDAQESVNQALKRRQDAEVHLKSAQQKEASSRIETEILRNQLDGEELDEETLRQAELADSIRRMAELREWEQAEREEEARKVQRDAEEKRRREREEAERLARQQKEREEQALRDAEARQRLYAQAVEKEHARCRLRDAQLFQGPFVLPWHAKRALERFTLVSEEFDTLKFHESQPLTFDSVPWPILAHPCAIRLETVDWTAVEKFFNTVEDLLNKTEYKALIEKAHRRFHPDKWRARGILRSVWDDDLRCQLEATGNVVAQAITPLWLKSREP